MNVHPMFVHFPIALLTTYAALELIRWRKITNQPYWFYLKAVLVIFGTAAGYVTLQTGSIARHLITDKTLRPLISVHSSWAELTIFIFGVLAAAYFVAWCNRNNAGIVLSKVPLVGVIWKWGTRIQIWITKTPLCILLAIAGFLALTITGALGGSIVYGSSLDPVTNWIYHLFFAQ